VKAFVAVNIDRQNTKLAEEFRRKVKEHPQVQACHMISGTIDFMLEVVADDLDAFGNFIDGELLSMPAVKDASSSIVLKVVKPKETMID
jgi:DNA-binding Lrp family transcriptional regulator